MNGVWKNLPNELGMEVSCPRSTARPCQYDPSLSNRRKLPRVFCITQTFINRLSNQLWTKQLRHCLQTKGHFFFIFTGKFLSNICQCFMQLSSSLWRNYDNSVFQALSKLTNFPPILEHLKLLILESFKIPFCYGRTLQFYKRKGQRALSAPLELGGIKQCMR